MTSIGLIVFLVALSIDVVAITVDAVLDLTGRKTISEHVRGRPWLGVSIVAVQVIGTAGLAVHFWWTVMAP